jgi:hypothetical protein
MSLLLLLSTAMAGGLTLEVSETVIDALVTFDVRGAGPGETVYLAWSSDSGLGPCPAALGGACLDLAAPVSLLTAVTADASGTASVYAVTPDLPGTQVCLQAGVLRGPQGADSVLTASTCRVFDVDTDGDGVPDATDPCPLDIGDDTDGDGVCDGDDRCPLDPADACDPYEDLTFVVAQGDAGGLTATCPTGTTIAFGWSLQTSTSHSGDACLKANTKACVSGDASCSQVACNTAGNDEAMILLACAPAGSSAHETTPRFANGDGGGNVVTCPAGEAIVMGFAYQWSDAHSSDACIKANQAACVPGAASCSQVSCDTAGNDESFIWALCAPQASALHDISVLENQGNAGNLAATCPVGESIVAGWSLQASTDHTGDACLKDNNGVCAPGDDGCATASCDTVGDDESFLFLACARDLP